LSRRRFYKNAEAAIAAIAKSLYDARRRLRTSDPHRAIAGRTLVARTRTAPPLGARE